MWFVLFFCLVLICVIGATVECPAECKEDRARLRDDVDVLKVEFLPRWFGIILASVLITVVGLVAYVYADSENRFVSKDTFAVSESRTRDDIKEIKQEIRENSQKVIEAIKELK